MISALFNIHLRWFVFIAVLDLNGRFFAGRVVKAGFYDAEKFRNLELADAPLST